jgi:dihydrofolate reductase
MIRHMVALDSKRGIAKDGGQPWKLPTDEHYFTEQTKLYGGVVLMGRTTYEVIGRPLTDRQNFVVTHEADFRAAGVTAVHDLDAFFARHSEVWVIGGGVVFAETMGIADELYITEIDEDYTCDTFYPTYSEDFTPLQTGEWLTEDDTRFRFMIYRPNSH